MDRLDYIKTKERLLQFFLIYSFNNEIEEFSTYDVFQNEQERMSHFIDIFDELYHDGHLFDCDLVIAKGKSFKRIDNIPFEIIQSIKYSNKVIKEYLGL